MSRHDSCNDNSNRIHPYDLGVIQFSEIQITRTLPESYVHQMLLTGTVNCRINVMSTVRCVGNVRNTTYC